MPYPTEYSSASADFDRFLDAVKLNAAKEKLKAIKI